MRLSVPNSSQSILLKAVNLLLVIIAKGVCSLCQVRYEMEIILFGWGVRT